MGEKITLTLFSEGQDTIEVDRAEYEAAKAAGELAEFLDVYTSDIETDESVQEPDGTVITLPEGNVLPPPEHVFLLWSYGAWWNKDGSYTADLWQADRYTEAEAMRTARRGDFNHYDLIVPAPESGRDPRFDVGELRRMDKSMAERIAAVEAGIAARKVEN